MSENHFAKALHNFTMDAACGDAIRHLTDRGYTFSQIRDSLTFPAPPEYIESVMYERLIETRKILLQEPKIVAAVSSSNASGTVDAASSSNVSGTVDAVSYEITETFDRYGRKSFLRVPKKTSEEMIFSPEDYVSYRSVWVLTHAQEQVSSLSDRILPKDRSTGSHRDR